MAAHDMSTCLVIRAPHQKFGDQQVYCSLDWSVQQLKQHLSKVYPSKPRPEDQKLIYSGQLLDDEVFLKDVFRLDGGQTHILHLVCKPAKDSSEAKQSPIPLMASSQPDLGITRGSVSPAPSASSVASASSPASTDGLRHRGPSNAVIPNGQLPFAMGLPPGVTSPEELMQQVVIAQQLYAHYFTQYMQFMRQVVPPVAPPAGAPAPPASSSPPVAAPAAAAAAAPPAPRAAPADNNRGPRMNAQGGPLLDEEEEEAAQRDWLDWVYTVSRATVLLGIVYFYSSFGRFMVVTGIALLMYLYQGGWFFGPRGQQQQQQEHGNDRNRAREANNQQQPQAAPMAERERPQLEGAGAAQLDGAGDQDGDAAVAPPPPPEEPRVSAVAMVWTFVATFFTSLIPEQPPPVNAN